MRSEAREAVFKAVFARLLGGECGKGARSQLYKTAKLGEEEKAFAESLYATVEAQSERYNAVINEKVTRFADYRIYPADRAAMLIALAELDAFDDIPPIVSVSEAVSLARKYSTEKSADFVNGVLGGIINQ